ncbi:hypothetical protein QJS04_geneDACA021867 [Acorus gramineus]|uniref:Sec-independent protein translocase protein TatB n=1 Tax=Acorus gramineus TaxID=55184 RepID=A0AAV9ARX0_ACOGR|nr:hypothetical protein QJS04_geneDACA021867 [Acorus gramineus]
MLFGISYGEIIILIAATTVVIGPKDLPNIARTAGRLAGRAIGHVQMARGQFESVLQQSQASKVHKELQDTMAQLEAIRHEIRSVSFLQPGPYTRKLMDSSTESYPANLHSQATAFARLAETPAVKTGSFNTNVNTDDFNNVAGLLTVLPVSAESAGLIPNHGDDTKGSDIFLEAIVEAEVARNAKQFFEQHQDQIQSAAASELNTK